MKSLKFLPLLMMLNITLCFGSDLERYKAFAEDEIAGRIETAKSESIEKRSVNHLTIEEIKAHFEETDKLFHELVDIIVDLDSEKRYDHIDLKLETIKNHTDQFFTGPIWGFVMNSIYRIEKQLLDITHKNGFNFIDYENLIIKKHVEILDKFFTFEEPDSDEDE